MKDRAEIEPGLLRLFRTLTLLRLLVVLAGSLLVTARRGWTAGQMLLLASDGALLLGYLFWPGLRRAMGRWYLPVALCLASVGPLLVPYLVIYASDGSGLAVLLNAWLLLPPLLIPVVLTAWQYGFRPALAVILVTGALDVLLATALVFAVGAAPFVAILPEAEPAARGFVGALGSRVFSLVVVGYMVARLVAEQRRQRAALTQANARLAGYAATLEQLATSRERNRLARELHDTMAHALSAMAVQLEAADAVWEAAPGEARRLVDQALDTTRTGLGETRRALQALRASPLEDLGLGLALRSLAESAAARGRFAVEVDVPETAARLLPATEQCVFRVCQEALENAVRHACARRVQVRLALAGGRAELTVVDDGQGFDVTAPDAEQRFGLAGMRERAELAGGVLTIESAAGAGTTVRLAVDAERGA